MALAAAFDADRSHVEFVTDGVHAVGFGIAHEDYGVRCANGDRISRWRSIEGVWHTLPLEVSAVLQDVGEWAVEGDALVVAGFEKRSGQ